MELNDRIGQLENDLAGIKSEIKQLLLDLKELTLRDQDPLTERTVAIPRVKVPAFSPVSSPDV